MAATSFRTTLFGMGHAMQSYRESPTTQRYGIDMRARCMRHQPRRRCVPSAISAAHRLYRHAAPSRPATSQRRTMSPYALPPVRADSSGRSHTPPAMMRNRSARSRRRAPEPKRREGSARPGRPSVQHDEIPHSEAKAPSSGQRDRVLQSGKQCAQAAPSDLYADANQDERGQPDKHIDASLPEIAHQRHGKTIGAIDC
jgi:hypothetical protein